jgi:hypothetical protein
MNYTGFISHRPLGEDGRIFLPLFAIPAIRILLEDSKE